MRENGHEKNDRNYRVFFLKRNSSMKGKSKGEYIDALSVNRVRIETLHIMNGI